MNVNDTEIAWSLLQKKGYRRTADVGEVSNSSKLFKDHVCVGGNIITIDQINTCCASRQTLSFW